MMYVEENVITVYNRFLYITEVQCTFGNFWQLQKQNVFEMKGSQRKAIETKRAVYSLAEVQDIF